MMPRLTVAALFLGSALGSALGVACASTDSAAPTTAPAGPVGEPSPDADAGGGDTDAGDAKPPTSPKDGAAPQACAAGYVSCGAPGGCCSAVKAQTLALGTFFSCAIVTGGAVKCWGTNAVGQGGRVSTSQSNVPVLVPGVTGAVQISASIDHVCAVLTGGSVSCWGNNSYGQLGSGTALGKGPVTVVGLGSATAVAAGFRHTCALLTSGAVKCWGRNSGNSLGDGTTTDSPVPVSVAGLGGSGVAITGGGLDLSDFPAEAPSSPTCLLTSAGAVQCWGPTNRGASGHDGNSVADAAGLTSGVVAVSARGEAHSCALLSSGKAVCWGSNSEGAVGNSAAPTNPASPFPAWPVLKVPSSIVQIESGGRHTCVLTSAGAVKCWGGNQSGQVGDGTDSFVRLDPVDVVGLSSGVVEIATGSRHNCVRTTTNGVKCWGSSGYGELGRTGDAYTPGDVVGL